MHTVTKPQLTILDPIITNVPPDEAFQKFLAYVCCRCSYDRCECWIPLMEAINDEIGELHVRQLNRTQERGVFAMNCTRSAVDVLAGLPTVRNIIQVDWNSSLIETEGSSSD